MAVLLLCRAPQARPARGPANMAAAASCGMAAADDAAETLDWLTNQAELASAQAIASQALQYSTSGVSWPPMLLGSSMRSRSCAASASTTSGVSSRRRSISGPCASSSACTARARSGALAASAGGRKISMNVSSAFRSARDASGVKCGQRRDRRLDLLHRRDDALSRCGRSLARTPVSPLVAVVVVLTLPQAPCPARGRARRSCPPRARRVPTGNATRREAGN